MGHIDSDFFPTVATNSLESKTALVIGNLVRKATKFAISSIEEGYENPPKSDHWMVLVKLENGNYFMAELINFVKDSRGARQVKGVLLSSSHQEALKFFIELLNNDEQQMLAPWLKTCYENNRVDEINFAFTRDKIQKSYRNYLSETGNPIAAKVQRSLEELASKLPDNEESK